MAVVGESYSEAGSSQLGHQFTSSASCLLHNSLCHVKAENHLPCRLCLLLGTRALESTHELFLTTHTEVWLVWSQEYPFPADDLGEIWVRRQYLPSLQLHTIFHHPQVWRYLRQRWKLLCLGVWMSFLRKQRWSPRTLVCL